MSGQISKHIFKTKWRLPVLSFKYFSQHAFGGSSTDIPRFKLGHIQSRDALYQSRASENI